VGVASAWRQATQQIMAALGPALEEIKKSCPLFHISENRAFAWLVGGTFGYIVLCMRPHI